MKNLIDIPKRCYLTEMAISLLAFNEKLESRINQILQNWCLVRFCDDNVKHPAYINRNHWASELYALMTDISSYKLKSGRKDKTVYNVLANELELDNSYEIEKRIKRKFIIEGLEKEVQTIAHICSLNIEDICENICKDEAAIYLYVSEPIG